MRPVDCPAADPVPPFLRMERKGDPGDGEKWTPGEVEWFHAREPQSCHRPLMLRLLNAAAPHRFQPRTLHPPEVWARSELSDYSRQDEVFRSGIRVSAQGQVYTWVLPHTIMRTFPFLDTLLLPHLLHNPLDLQSARNHGTTLFHQGLGWVMDTLTPELMDPGKTKHVFVLTLLDLRSLGGACYPGSSLYWCANLRLTLGQCLWMLLPHLPLFSLAHFQPLQYYEWSPSFLLHMSKEHDLSFLSRDSRWTWD